MDPAEATVPPLESAAPGSRRGSASRSQSTVRRVTQIADDVLAAVGTLLGALDRTRVARCAAPRLARVATQIAAIAAGYRIERARRDIAGDCGDPAALDRLHERSAHRLAAMCRELGGGVLKIGQFLSTRPDLLPAAYVRELSRLQDDAAAVPAAAIRARIEAELGARASAFASIDDKPLATASLAQVHAATLTDGTAVAIKVQLPKVDELIAADMAALPALAALIGELCPWLDTDVVAGELARSIRAELDFAAEAASARTLAAAFAGDPGVIVPAVIDSLSTGRVITMERIHGARLTDALASAGPAERDRLLATLVGVVARQILELGLFQADPHPGNFLVAAGPRLALLDFGNVGRLTDAQRRGYARLILAMVGRDLDTAAEALTALGFAASSPSLGGARRRRAGEHSASPRYPEAEGARDWAELVCNILPRGAELAALDPAAELERLLALARDNPIGPLPRHFILIARVLASVGGLIVHHRPNIDVAGLVYGWIRQQSVSY